MKKDQGQINRGSTLGEEIYKLAKRDDVDYVFEIGTWNGLGSTKCIIDGIRDARTLKKGMSIDCNLKRSKEALGNLVHIPRGFLIKQGTVVETDELAPLLNKLKSTSHKKWLEEDLKWIESSSNVFDELPMVIDLCVMDGGEFSGTLEFFKLWKRCRYMVLDDTITLKHSQSRKFIINHPELFEIVMDNTRERNGFMICKNKNYV